MIRIKNISLIKANNEVSSIDFDDGFNLIYGPSNTGKSVVVDCIDFVFGSKKPVNNNFSPKEVKLEVQCDDGHATLTRVCGKNSIFVEETDIEGLECKEYPQKSKNSMNASDVLMRLIGLKDSVEIINSAKWDTQHLTFRTFSHMLLLGESEITKEESILKSEHDTAQTAFRSALLYLLTEENHIDPNGNPVEKAQKRKILVKYLEEQIEKYKLKIEKLSNFKRGEASEVKKEIDEYVAQMNNAQEKLNKAVEESKEISKRLYAVNDKIIKDTNFLNKYEDLLSQYESDLRRMEMIVDGKAHEAELDKPLRCPYCNGELQKEEEQTCEEAAQAELLRLVPQIKDLKEAKVTLSAELEALNKDKENLVKAKKERDSVINSELKPLILNIEQKIARLEKAITNEADYKNSLEHLDELNKELKEVMKTPEVPPQYNPNTYLEPLIIHRMKNYIGNILTECKCKFDEFDFDIKSLDLSINGHPKANEGEGFRGFYNTVIALALQLVLCDCAVIKPGFLIIDSPIMALSLRQDMEESEKDSLKNALFEYLKAASKRIQIIVVENSKPAINYDGCKVTEFTKNPNVGRFGFVKNYQD